MKIYNIPVAVLIFIFLTNCSVNKIPYQGLDESIVHAVKDTVLSDVIIYHKVRVDQNGNILPWYSANPGESYDHVLGRVWHFRKNMEVDSNGKKLKETGDSATEGWSWQTLGTGGILTISHPSGNQVSIAR